MLVRVLRCRFCGHEMRVSHFVYLQNPFCARCLNKRIALMGATPHETEGVDDRATLTVCEIPKEKKADGGDRMYIVTLDGKVMCEGTPDEDCDFHIDHDNPVFHDTSSVHPESVIQLWRFGGIAPLKHLVYVAKLDDEGKLQLVARKV